MRVTNYALPPENKIDDAKRMPLSFSNYITVKGLSHETAILWPTILYQRKTIFHWYEFIAEALLAIDFFNGFRTVSSGRFAFTGFGILPAHFFIGFI
jgi:hypothetical protein